MVNNEEACVHMSAFSNSGVLMPLEMAAGVEVEVIVIVMAAAPVAMKMQTWMRM
jgi:hypothetical protein